MSILIWILLVLLALTGALLIALVTLPLRLELQLDREEALLFTAALQPFGRFGPRMVLSSRKQQTEMHKNKVDSNRTAPSTKKKPRDRSQRDLIRIARAAIRLFVELVGTIRFDHANLDVRFGLGDPAATGEAYGQMTPLLFGTMGCSRFSMKVEPVFEEITLTGRATVCLSVIPAQLFPPIVRFGWSAFGPTP